MFLASKSSVTLGNTLISPKEAAILGILATILPALILSLH